MSMGGQDPIKESVRHDVQQLWERLAFPRRTREILSVWLGPLAFTVVALLPLFKRLRHPTILGDDVIRIVDLINLPFDKHLFQPFGDHLAPGFQLVSWLTWEAIGHDIRLAPLGFSFASVTAWVFVLVLLGLWLKQETGSTTATLVALAVVAQSPLVLETAWWYSSSSFSWAVAGILIAVLGASRIGRRPRSSLFWIGIGSALGPAGTTLGILAAPLAILRAASARETTRRNKLLAVVAAAVGFFCYEEFSRLGPVAAVHSARVQSLPSIDVLGGLGYTVTVPGRVLLPSTLGVPASWLVKPLPPWVVLVAGALVLLATVALVAWPRSRWDRRFVLVGAAMIYWSYSLTYSPRVAMMRAGFWTEREFLYNFAARYHVLPLMGMAAVVAALLASWPLVKRCDSRRGLPAIVGTIVGLLMLVAQHREAKQWGWMLNQPGQRETLSALHHLGEIARDEGVSRSQLLRMFDPAWRSWNGSVQHDRPHAFHLMRLAVRAPDNVELPLADHEARSRLLACLTQEECMALGAGTIASPASLQPDVLSQTLAIARSIEIQSAIDEESGPFRMTNRSAYVEFAFDPVANARYLWLPGIAIDQDVYVSWCDSAGRWRPGQSLRLSRSDQAASQVTIDLIRLVHWPAYPVARIRVKSTAPDKIALIGAPRLLR
jgi:hypothetical protein